MRARLIWIVVLTALLLLAVPNLTRSVASPAHPPRPAPTVVYTVQAGDTLWAIAVRLQPTGDPRPLVDRLQSMNHLRGPLLAGEQIVVPATSG